MESFSPYEDELNPKQSINFGRKEPDIVGLTIVKPNDSRITFTQERESPNCDVTIDQIKQQALG